MTERLPRLLELQACDQRIQQAIHTRNTLQQSFAALQEGEQQQASEIRARQNKIDETQKVGEHLSLQLDQVKGQLRAKRGALPHRRAGHQEEQAQREIAFLEATKAALKEELRTVKAQLKRDAAVLRQAEASAVAQHNQTLDTLPVLAAQIATAEEEIHAARQLRLQLSGRIDPALLREYERIFSYRGGVAVVALTHETCQGCRMHLPLQLCLELQRKSRLTFCPHCHRILFVPSEPRPSQESPEHSSRVSHGNGVTSQQQRRQSRVRGRNGKHPQAVPLSSANLN